MVRGFLLFVIGWLLLAASALGQERVALIIGNANYASVGTLANPLNDATDLAAALTRIGFDVTLATDLDINGMRTSLRAFRDKADGADMSLVYFAGHGVEIEKQNYLIPVDADLRSDSDVLFDTIPLDLMTEAVSRSTTLRIVIIDACRDNPFLGQIRNRDGTSRALTRAGLSPFEPLGGTVVAYAAKGGTVALDGNGRNSPFMRGLLAHIEEPGLDISLMFRKVRDSVLAETNNQQEPFTYGSLPGREIYLVPPVAVADVSPSPAAPGTTPAPPAAATQSAEEFAWSRIKDSTDRTDFEEFVQAFPGGAHVGEAFDRIVALTAAVSPAAPAGPSPDRLPEAVPQPLPAAEPQNLALAIQTELDRAGCEPGPLDGAWGSRSRAAVLRFGERARLALADTEPSETLLGLLRSRPGSVCTGPAVAAPQIAGCPVFPVDNIWNTPIDALPVDPRSADYVASIGASATMHPDFGAMLYEGGPIGLPYVVVPFTQPRVEIRYAPHEGEEPAPDESDAGPYPIPPDAPIEGGPDCTGDRHVIVVQEQSCTLFELYKARPNPDGSWTALSSARFDLEGNELRPEGWTSTDAAGLPIFPGLVRFDEVAAGEINHALRFTAPLTRRSYVWPARHFASSSDDPALPAMGQRFRLKASVDISGFSPANQVILRALKTYGMILADNGSPWFLTGAPSPEWNDDNLRQLTALSGADFEAVDTSSLMVDSDSAAVRLFTPAPAPVVAAPAPTAPVSRTAVAVEEAAPPASACYDVFVTVAERDPSGVDWDPWGGSRANPDPVIIEQTTGARAACNDTFSCALRINGAGQSLSLLIEDDDPDASDPIGSGQCRVGRSCTLGSARVSMSAC